MRPGAPYKTTLLCHQIILNRHVYSALYHTKILEIAHIYRRFTDRSGGGESAKFSRYLESLFGQTDYDISLVLTDTDNLYFKECRYIGSTDISVKRFLSSV